ncbi:hypothetical protein [Legionella sp. W05-934-2]|uniref:hypothetical protein n=1 Tax=Legionella sp. W05-934-2 TaxID=1198649 RepID=UPI003461B129
MSKGLLILLMLVCFGAHAKGELDANEKKIVAIIHQNEKQEIEFIQKTVNINSGTFNLNGVKKVAKLYDKSLKKLGFKTEWITLPAKMRRAGQLSRHP